MGISSSGLASGIDTDSVVKQLVAIEQAKVTKVEKKKEDVENTQEKFSTLQTNLINLANKAASLDDAKDFNLFQTLSNNDEYAVVSGGEDAVSGTYELVVNQLATSQKIASTSFGAINTPIGDTGVFSISTSKAAQEADPSKKNVEISIDDDDTLKDVVAKINSAEGVGARASLMTLANGDNRIVLTAVDEGTGGFTMESVSGDNVLGAGSLGLMASNQSVQTENSLVTLDGAAATSSTKFSELTTGLVANNLVNGDKIHIKGVNADGTAVETDFAIANVATATVGQFVDFVKTAFGANTDVSLNSSGQLVLTDKDAIVGAQPLTMTLSLTNSAGVAKTNSLALGGVQERSVYTNTLNEAQNAFYMLDGMAISSQSNSDSDTIRGTTFTLKKADPTKTVKVSLEQDTAGISDKIKGFVEEFNAVMKMIDENTKTTVTEDKDGKKTRNKGVFSGDSYVSSVRSALRSMMTSTLDGLVGKTQYSSLSRVGIVTDKEGYLEVDDKKLTKALETDLDGVRRLFTVNSYSSSADYTLGQYTDDTKAGTYYVSAADGYISSKQGGSDDDKLATDQFGNLLSSTAGNSKGLTLDCSSSTAGAASFTFVRGIANQLSLFVKESQDSVDGFFKKTKEVYDKRIEGYESRIESLQNRVDNYETRLLKQFNAMETAMSRLSSQTSNLLSQLS